MENSIFPVKEGRYVCIKSCGHPISSEYYNGRYPKLSVGAVGQRGHGKTMYLTSLFYALDWLMNSPDFWHDFYYQAHDPESLKLLTSCLANLRKGELPPATCEVFPTPTLIKFRHLPLLGCSDTYDIAFYDTGGEVFNDERVLKIGTQGRFMSRVSVAWFLVSLPNIEKSGEPIAQTMSTFLNKYLMGLKDVLNYRPKDQHLIVVLTKADELQDPWVSEFLDSDRAEEWPPSARTLVSNSYEVSDWLERKGCRGFLKAARAEFRSVEFCMVSALGARPADDRRIDPNLIKPKRVLEPFFWVLLKTDRSLLDRLWRFFHKRR
jgi:hypothetical protein